jgi:pyrroloquinoline quinone biosynthesis protein B
MKSSSLSFSLIFLVFFSYSQTIESDYIQVLGIVQDAGYPHIGCEKDCCKVVSPGDYFVSCLGLVDKTNNKRYLFDATPDIHNQINLLEKFPEANLIDGIFLTHAHIGHYTGLMYLGREGLGGKNIMVYALKRMARFLTKNGPWDQLVKLNNISIQTISNKEFVKLSKNIFVMPIRVPHRDEYSETVGYKIIGKSKKILFIPDIDKWDEWKKSIIEEIKLVDYAFIDGTFYNGSELNRDMREIPHPSIEETLQLFSNQPLAERNKIYFIHINHTNPILTNKNGIRDLVESLGFNIAERGLKFKLD